MISFSLLVLIFTVFQSFCTSSSLRDFPTKNFSLAMPFPKVNKEEMYLCTAVKLDNSQDYYIVGFDVETKSAHHMLLYGCTTPGLKASLFNCGSMAEANLDVSSSLDPCSSGSTIVYAWSHNATHLSLPKDVGFHVGGRDSGIHWLVLQVHYADIQNIPDTGDDSKVHLTYTNVPQPKYGGVLWTGTNGRIPGNSITHMEAACSISDDITIHPFAFRVHTHKLGTVVSGYKVSPAFEWTLLGKVNPQRVQKFYETVNQGVTLTQGDTLATRCTMLNTREDAVWVGSSRFDEMCNYYLMYWVDGRKGLSQTSCLSIGPPLYTWSRWLIGGNLKNIPELDASTLEENNLI